MRWDLEGIAAITAGVATGSAAVTSVASDSRLARPGALFVAIRGERHDGHAFIADAMERGAAACLVETGRLPAGIAGVEVADTLASLAALGAARRDALSVPVVAVTGSSGKTTTKDMVAAALGAGAHAAPQSFNNEVGVPLTLLATPDGATAVVCEVGSRGVGHISALARVIRPDVAVITNIGPAHLEMFGDIDTVARAKWELVEALGDGGVAVLPVDAQLPHRAVGAEISFGESEEADVAVVDLVIDHRGRPTFTVTYGESSARMALPFAGRHQARNAAAAIGAALALGIDLAEAARRLPDATLSRWRMEVTEVEMGGGSVTLVNDAYNANPDSMSAALRTVAEMPGRHLAVLGMMHELGTDEGRLHREVGEMAARLGFSKVVVVGEDPGIAEGAGTIAVPVPDAAAAVARVGEMARPGDVVLVKASRASGLEVIAEGLATGVAP